MEQFNQVILRGIIGNARIQNIGDGSHDNEYECRIHWQSYLYGFMDAAYDLLGMKNFQMDSGDHPLSFLITVKGKEPVEYFMLFDNEGQELVYKIANDGRRPAQENRTVARKPNGCKKIERKMKTIQIAPDWKECTIEGCTVTGTLGERVFHYTVPEPFDLAYADGIKQAFCAAIALASKPWQITDALNRYFDTEGKFYED